MKLLSDSEREVLIEECKLNCLDHMFGDGQEEQYVVDGFPTFIGLNNMTDEQLLIEHGHYNIGDTPTQMAERWQAELSEGDNK